MPKQTKSPTMHELEQDIFRTRRENLIDRMLRSHKGMKYIQQLSREQLEAASPNHLPILDAKLNGNEVSVEYHLFELADSLPIIQQLRLTAPPETRRLVDEIKRMGL